MMFHNKKGFTLIEMLVVIAIIAVLVAIIVPTVSLATNKARAATDAANLRSILGVMNSGLVSGRAPQDIVKEMNSPDCKTIADAKAVLLYDEAGFIKVYFKKGNDYYGLDYFITVSGNGKTDSASPVAKPAASDGTLYEVGTGTVIS